MVELLVLDECVGGSNEESRMAQVASKLRERGTKVIGLNATPFARSLRTNIARLSLLCGRIGDEVVRGAREESIDWFIRQVKHVRAVADQMVVSRMLPKEFHVSIHVQWLPLSSKQRTASTDHVLKLATKEGNATAHFNALDRVCAHPAASKHTRSGSAHHVAGNTSALSK